MQSELVVREPPELATGEQQRERLCGRGRSDPVLDVFCGPEPPPIDGIVAVREALGLESNHNGIEQGFALTGHSTSLVSRSVSAINPRIIFVRLETERQELLSLAYARGEQFTEMVVRDRNDGELEFYLLTFRQACDDSESGCAPGDLLTEAAETGWRDVNVYAEEDLENTPRDCRVCHQPDGPGTPKFLRMQELQPPWNHWFWRLVPGGQALLADYYAAKGDEPLAGVPGPDIESSQPGLLSATLFAAGSQDQPNEFVSSEIQREVIESAAERGGNQPEDNSIPGHSETWQGLYERSKRGEVIPVPYHDVKVTDPGKLAQMTQAYVDYRTGRIAREDLPDIRQVFPDDPQRLAHMGFATEPGLTGEEVLLQACGLCHNDRLDQSLSRARFNVDLSQLDREAKDRAIARIKLPRDNPSAMPPPLFRSLTDEARERLIELLEQ